MTPRRLAALVRHAVARLEYFDPEKAREVVAEHALGVHLAEAVMRGLVREVTHAGRAALIFTYGQLVEALDAAAARHRLNEIEKENDQ